MKKAIKRNTCSLDDYDSYFEDFINCKRISGLSPATLKGYQDSYKNLKKFLDGAAVTEALYLSYIEHMQSTGQSLNSVNHYIRCDRAFLYWCMKQEFIGKFSIRLVKVQETVKDVYTQGELALLIKEPSRDAAFTEWRCWAITNFILATAAREATVCSIRMKDVSFEDRTVIFQHLKNKKVQILPLSDALYSVLKKYIRLWRTDCSGEDFLFPNNYNAPLTTNALKHAQSKYNRSRGVSKTSVHLLRHAFVKNWCMAGGNVFKLQKVLGHSTLAMTQHYANLYSADLKADFENFVALDNLTPQKRQKIRRI